MHPRSLSKRILIVAVTVTCVALILVGAFVGVARLCCARPVSGCVSGQKAEERLRKCPPPSVDVVVVLKPDHVKPAPSESGDVGKRMRDLGTRLSDTYPYVRNIVLLVPMYINQSSEAAVMRALVKAVQEDVNQNHVASAANTPVYAVPIHTMDGVLTARGMLTLSTDVLGDRFVLHTGDSVRSARCRKGTYYAGDDNPVVYLRALVPEVQLYENVARTLGAGRVGSRVAQGVLNSKCGMESVLMPVGKGVGARACTRVLLKRALVALEAESLSSTRNSLTVDDVVRIAQGLGSAAGKCVVSQRSPTLT